MRLFGQNKNNYQQNENPIVRNIKIQKNQISNNIESLIIGLNNIQNKLDELLGNYQQSETNLQRRQIKEKFIILQRKKKMYEKAIQSFQNKSIILEQMTYQGNDSKNLQDQRIIVNDELENSQKQKNQIQQPISQREDENLQCCICLEASVEDLTKLHCKHIFHKKCIEKWQKQSLCCPICRQYSHQKEQIHYSTFI